LVLRIRRRRAWPRDIDWWHSIDLGSGKVTPGTKTAALLEREASALHLPDLAGKSVLDIGAWDGYYSFLAERAGARRVVALDYYTWSVHLPAFQAHVEDSRRRGEPFRAPHEQAALWDPEGLPGKRGFDLAHRLRNSRVEAIVAGFTTVDLDALGTFDVVLFLGVIYHLENPLAAARRLREITRELAVVESEAIHVPGEEDRPMWTSRVWITSAGGRGIGGYRTASGSSTRFERRGSPRCGRSRPFSSNRHLLGSPTIGPWRMLIRRGSAERSARHARRCPWTFTNRRGAARAPRAGCRLVTRGAGCRRHPHAYQSHRPRRERSGVGLARQRRGLGDETELDAGLADRGGAGGGPADADGVPGPDAREARLGMHLDRDRRLRRE
jgi:SAM-dependent methyltransferase